MHHLLRSKGPRGYGALMLFLVVYLAALALILAPEGSLSSAPATTVLSVD